MAETEASLRPDREPTWAENSLAAFSQAVALGYRYLETDVHLTADGVLVAFHDDRLDRVTDRRGKVADLRFEEVSQARIGGELSIPTLEELLVAFRTHGDDVDSATEHNATEHNRPRSALSAPLNPGPVRINVDLKARGTVLPTWRLLERHAGSRAGDRVCVASFSSARLWVFRALCRWSRLRGRSAAATSAGPLGVAALRLLPWFVSRWVHSPGVAYQVPVATVVRGREVTLVTREFVRRAHALGKQVHVWTVNDEAEMHRLLNLGVDGIITDTVDTLARVLTERAGKS